MPRSIVIRSVFKLTVLGVFFSMGASAQPPPAAKKLIELGWDMPTAEYVRENIREMEKKPFDGLIFHLAGWPESGNVFSRKKWDEAKLQGALDACRDIAWQKFTDNFIGVLSASDMDWFSDADWEAVRYNLDILARAAALARCRGLCFDPEPYGNNPWNYSTQPHAGEKSFAEYEAKVRQRGAEYMRTISGRLPQAVIHCLYLLSICGNVADEPDGDKRERMLAQRDSGLYPAFINGMLDAAGPDITFTEGNEFSYYYTKPMQFYLAYHRTKHDLSSLLAPENIAKYKQKVKVSQALYVDYVFGYGNWAGKRWSPAPKLSRAERMRWFESNAFYASKTSEEFVWLYSEEMSWWKNTGEPPGIETILDSTRRKIARGEALGFVLPELPKK